MKRYSDTVSCARLTRFLTNPRPHWWESAATWLGLALLLLLATYLVGGFSMTAQGLRIPAQLRPDGLTPSALVEGPVATNVRLHIEVFYQYSNVLGVEKGSMSFILPLPPIIDQRFIDLLASNPEVLAIRVDELAGSADRHYDLASRSLRAASATITHWTPIAYVLVPLKWTLIALMPTFVLVALVRLRESRRCQFSANRWFAGLCPVCKYPRNDAAGDTCPECGRNMPEQAALAGERMNRSLDDADDWISARERKRSKRELMHDTTPTP